MFASGFSARTSTRFTPFRFSSLWFLVAWSLFLMASNGTSVMGQGCAPGSTSYPCVYVADYSNNKISVIDSTTNTAQATSISASDPIGLVVSPDNAYVWTATLSSNGNSGVLSVIDAANGMLSSGVENTFISSLSNLAFTPDGRFLLVGGTFEATDNVQILNTVTKALTGVGPKTINSLTPFSFPQGVAYSGGFAYLADTCSTTTSSNIPATEACIDVIDPAATSLVNIIGSGNPVISNSNATDTYRYVTIAPGNSTAYVVESAGSEAGYNSAIDILNLYTGQFTGSLFLSTDNATNINAIAVTPDGSQVYALIQSQGMQYPALYVFNTETSRGFASKLTAPAPQDALSPIAVGVNPSGLAISPDGLKLYVANAGDGTVSVVSTTTNTTTNTITVGGSPQSIAVMQDLPAPWIDQPLSPNAAPSGSGDVTLTVNGAGLVPSSTVNWNGAALTTTYVGRNQLTATVPAADLATDGTFPVTVTNPGPSGGGTSNVAYFSVTSPTSNLTFTGPPSQLTVAHPDNVLSGDFDNDGKLDLAIISNPCSNSTTTCTTNGSLTGLHGNGDGTFTGFGTTNVGVQPGPAVIGNFDGKGLGLAILNQCDSSGNCLNKSVSILVRNGNEFAVRNNAAKFTSSEGSGDATLVAGDFNGDGNLDLFVANQADSSYNVFLGNGDGSFSPNYIVSGGITGSIGTGPYALATGDFNEDGTLDVVVLNTGDDSFTVLLGNGDGTFQPTQISLASLVSNALLLAVGDFNNDGKLDLAVIGNAELTVLLGNGNGTFRPPLPAVGVGYAVSLTTADFNGDGNQDLAFLIPSGDPQAGYLLLFSLGNGDGTFQPIGGPGTPSGSTAIAMTPGDFNGDGRLDVAVADPGGPIYINLQSAVPTFNPNAAISFSPQIIGTTSSPQTLTLSNTGSAPLVFSSLGTIPPISIGGSNQVDFQETNDCSTRLEPGSACTFELTFTPAALHSRSANLILIIGELGNSSVYEIPLSGTGIDQTPSITTPPQSQTINAGQTATLSVAATGTAPLTYQWFQGTSPNMDTPVTGVMSSPPFTTPPLTATTSYWVQVCNAICTNSNSATITVITTPTITTEPMSQTINTGQTAVLSVVAAGTTPSYQWYQGTSPSTANPIAGATSPSYTTPALNTTTSYWVQVKNQAGTANSNTATVTVITPVAITTPPASQTIVAGQMATLVVAATGTAPLAYQWYQGTSPNTANPVSGATNSSLTSPPLVSAANYWVRVSNQAGSANSATAMITVDLPPLPSCTLEVSALAPSSTANGQTQYPVNAQVNNCTGPQGEPLITTISWGDGSPATNGDQGSHIYNAAGTFTVMASGAPGLTGTVSNTVTLNPPPTGVFSGQSTQIPASLPAATAGIGVTQVTFVCSTVSAVINGKTTTGPPTNFGISCTAPTVTLSSSSQTVNVTIQTTGTAASASLDPSLSSAPIYALVIPLSGICLLGAKKRQPRNRVKLRAWSALLALALAFFAFSACGGGQFTPPPTQTHGGGGGSGSGATLTASGTYYITITDQVVPPSPSTGFVQTSLVVPLPVTQSPQ